MIDDMIRQNKFVLYSPSRKFVYIMGIIDYLGEWNLQKIGEAVGKRFKAHFTRQDTNFSAKPPGEYADRFLTKIKSIFRAVEQQTFQEPPQFSMLT